MKPSRRYLQKVSEYIVTIYDKPQSNRVKYRQQHLDQLPVLFNAGQVTNVGAILENGEFIGSHLNVRGANKSAVLDLLKQDVYAREGVWDMNSVVIHKYGVALRAPFP